MGQHVCFANASFKADRTSCGVEFPNWNPQSEFTSDEEKPKFQGF
ncbi:hypothetical protein [Anaerotignum sp.]